MFVAKLEPWFESTELRPAVVTYRELDSRCFGLQPVMRLWWRCVEGTDIKEEVSAVENWAIFLADLLARREQDWLFVAELGDVCVLGVRHGVSVDDVSQLWWQLKQAAALSLRGAHDSGSLRAIALQRVSFLSAAWLQGGFLTLCSSWLAIVCPLVVDCFENEQNLGGKDSKGHVAK